MTNAGQQQTIYTIHESQLNNGGGSGNSAGGANVMVAPMSSQSFTNGNGNNGNNTGQRNNSNGSGPADILIDTSSIPVSNQQPMAPMQHQHHLQPQQQQQYNDTITSQPVAAAMAAGSSRVAPEQQNVVYSVHPVFNMLDQHQTLLIRQRADCTSTCCGFESANTYTVRSKDGSPILKAIENSNCCERCCFEGNREYNLSLVHGDEIVARIRKPYRVSRFCCYSNAVRIESPEDNPIGQIKQLFTLFGHPRYAIYDCQLPPQRPSFLLESISCRFCCTPFLCTCVCGNKEFRIIEVDSRDEVGTISRHLASSSSPSQRALDQRQQPQADLEQQQVVVEQQPDGGGGPGNDLDEPFGGGSDDQLFGVQFSGNLEARHKVLLLSACFMMDFFYFENDRRRRKLANC